MINQNSFWCHIRNQSQTQRHLKQAIYHMHGGITVGVVQTAKLTTAWRRRQYNSINLSNTEAPSKADPELVTVVVTQTGKVDYCNKWKS